MIVSDDCFYSSTHRDEMCNFYIMYYTDPSTGASFYACADNRAPELVNQIPADSDVALPPNPSLDDIAEGNSYEGKPVDLVDAVSNSNISLRRNDDYVVDDSDLMKDNSARPRYDGSLLENTHRGRWHSNQHEQGNQYRPRNQYMHGNQYAGWTQRKHHAQDNQYESTDEEEQEAMKQRFQNLHPFADPAEDENPIVDSQQDASSILTDPSTTIVSVAMTVAPSAGSSTQLIASIMDSVIRSSPSSKLDDWMFV